MYRSSLTKSTQHSRWAANRNLPLEKVQLHPTFPFSFPFPFHSTSIKNLQNFHMQFLTLIYWLFRHFMRYFLPCKNTLTTNRDQGFPLFFFSFAAFYSQKTSPQQTHLKFIDDENAFAEQQSMKKFRHIGRYPRTFLYRSRGFPE